MSDKTHLTNASVKGIAIPGDVAVYVRDTKLTGFCVSISPKGKRTFYFYGRISGKPKRLKIGTFPEINATDAREICKAIIGDRAKGKDIENRRLAGRHTLGDLFDMYLKVHSKPTKRTWKLDVRDFDRFCGNWKAKMLTEIRRGMIAELVSTVQAENGASAAHKIRALLSKMFNVGIKHEWCEFNPVTGTDRPKLPSRDRYLRPDEITKFFEAVDQLQRESSRDLIRLAVYTGARRGNLCSLEWQELDLNRGVWTIPKEKFKGKRVHSVPLIPQAIEILQRRKQDAVSGVPWVFPSGGKAGHVMDPKVAMKRVKELSGIEDLRFHDLRRTMGAWQNNGGTPTRIIQGTLGHSNIATTATSYSPNESEPIRQAMQMAVDAMTQQVREGEK